MGATFLQLNNPLSATLIVENYAPDLDTCEVTETSVGSVDEFEIPSIDGVTTTFTTISAGQTLVLTSSAGSYAELGQVSVAGFTSYEPTVESIGGPLPDSLVLDIPGADFPAYSNISIPALGTLEMTSPAAGIPVTPSTNFAWTAAAIPNAYIELSATSINLTTGAFTSVTCSVADDGAFSFPAATQSEMGANFSSLFSFTAQRQLDTVLQSGASVLIVESKSGS